VVDIGRLILHGYKVLQHVEINPPIIWMGKTRCGWVEISEEQKRSPKVIDSVSYTLKMDAK